MMHEDSDEFAVDHDPLVVGGHPAEDAQVPVISKYPLDGIATFKT